MAPLVNGNFLVKPENAVFQLEEMEMEARAEFFAALTEHAPQPAAARHVEDAP